MKKPNLKSIKGPNRAAKYAKAMKAYNKYRQSLVKSPGGKIVKSSGGKIQKASKPGQLATRPKVVSPTAKQLPPAGGTSGKKVIQTKSQKQAAANKRAEASKLRREKAQLKKTRAARGSGPTPGRKPIKGMPRNRLKEVSKSVVNKVRKFPYKKVGGKLSKLSAKTGVVGKIGGRALLLKAGYDTAKDIKRSFGPGKDGKYRGLGRLTLAAKKLSGKNKKTKQVAKKKVVPGTRINEYKGPKQPKIDNKVTNVSNKKVEKKNPSSTTTKTKSTVIPAVNKTVKTVSTTKKPSTNPFRRTKGEGIEGKSDGYRGDTRITKKLKKSGFTETRLAKLREKNAAFQKAKKGGKKAMEAYRKKYPKK